MTTRYRKVRKSKRSSNNRTNSNSIAMVKAAVVNSITKLNVINNKRTPIGEKHVNMKSKNVKSRKEKYKITQLQHGVNGVIGSGL